MEDRPSAPQEPQPSEHTGAGDAVRYRPVERFWPYVELPEIPTDEELAALDPDLLDALSKPAVRPFSMTIVFPKLDPPAYARAVELARQASEYREVGTGDTLRHRARYLAGDAAKLQKLWQVVGVYDSCEVLVDDRPVPYARELWLPLFFFLVGR